VKKKLLTQKEANEMSVRSILDSQRLVGTERANERMRKMSFRKILEELHPDQEKSFLELEPASQWVN
jgi:hypothetical protein